MSIKIEVEVAELKEQMKQVQFQMAQVMSALAAMVEVDNAVVEGSTVEHAVRNGKIKKTHR